MRPIPYSLKQKLSERFKASSVGTEARLKVIASPTAGNILISEPIHKNISAAYGDVALRQTAEETDIGKAYAVCIDDGIANIYQRDFPATMEKEWRYLWTLGPATEVAIEFDGTWIMDKTHQHWRMATEALPYIFFVREGRLYVQHWHDEESRMELAEGVYGEIAAIRGWTSAYMPSNDQGLIISYLRDGEVFYRSYRYRDESSRAWEREEQVYVLGNGNNTLSLFRTNDFRIGFLAESSGDVYLALTERNYSNMSVKPETVYAHPIRAIGELIAIERVNAQENESVSALACFAAACLDDGTETEPVSVLRVEKLNDSEESFTSYGFVLYLDKQLYGAIPSWLPNSVKLSASGYTGLSCTGIDYDSERNAFTVFSNKSIHRTRAVTISIPSIWDGSMYISFAGARRWGISTITAVSEAEKKREDSFNDECFNAGVYSAEASLIPVRNCYAVTMESISAEITAASGELESSGVLPI